MDQPHQKPIPIPGPPTSLDKSSPAAARRRSRRGPKREPPESQKAFAFMSACLPVPPEAKTSGSLPLLLLLAAATLGILPATAGAEQKEATAPRPPDYLTEEAPLAPGSLDVGVEVDVLPGRRDPHRQRRFHFQLSILKFFRSHANPRADRRERFSPEPSTRKHSRANRRRAKLDQLPPVEPRRRRHFPRKPVPPNATSGSSANCRFQLCRPF